MAELKLWKCKDGHVMGQVKWKGHGESQLLLFRAALDLAPVAEGHAVEQEVMAVLEGYVTVTVVCSICGQMRMWVPGEEALGRLIAARQRMVKNQRVLEDLG